MRLFDFNSPTRPKVKWMVSMIKKIVAWTMLCMVAAPVALAESQIGSWDQVVAAAKGQTVYWNAWAGDSRTNDFIEWASAEVKSRFGVEVVHVKISDTSEAVTRVIAERSAGNDENGAVDLIWINGENFSTMKQNGLLFGPWAESLPNFPLTDPDNNPGVRADFTIPVEGFEAPWGKAQVVFYFDAADLSQPPLSMPELLAWAQAHPGRFTYPGPPDFLGSTFLKQALIELTPDRSKLYAPVNKADFAAATKPLWAFLDKLHPVLWRSGRAFPANGSELRQLMSDNELSIGFSFNPGEAASAVASGEFPGTVRSYILQSGTIGNVSFLGIPYNSKNKAGAMVLSNFLLSPEAQSRQHNPRYLGMTTVLAVEKLDAPSRALFDDIEHNSAALRPEELGRALSEPHPSWMEELEKEWQRRFIGK